MSRRLKARRVAHKSTGGIFLTIPPPVDPVGVCCRGTEGVQHELKAVS